MATTTAERKKPRALRYWLWGLTAAVALAFLVHWSLAHPREVRRCYRLLDANADRVGPVLADLMASCVDSGSRSPGEPGAPAEPPLADARPGRPLEGVIGTLTPGREDWFRVTYPDRGPGGEGGGTSTAQTGDLLPSPSWYGWAGQARVHCRPPIAEALEQALDLPPVFDHLVLSLSDGGILYPPPPEAVLGALEAIHGEGGDALLDPVLKAFNGERFYVFQRKVRLPGPIGLAAGQQLLLSGLIRENRLLYRAWLDQRDNVYRAAVILLLLMAAGLLVGATLRRLPEGAEEPRSRGSHVLYKGAVSAIAVAVTLFLAFSDVHHRRLRHRYDDAARELLGSVWQSAIATSGAPRVAPVLPYGLRFAVLDRQGKVLRHSDAHREERENLLEEVARHRELRDLLAGLSVGEPRDARPEDRELSFVRVYDGRRYQFLARPITKQDAPGMSAPRGALTFYDLDLLHVARLERLWLGAGPVLWSLLGLMVTVVLLLLPGAKVTRPAGRAAERWTRILRAKRLVPSRRPRVASVVGLAYWCVALSLALAPALWIHLAGVSREVAARLFEANHQELERRLVRSVVPLAAFGAAPAAAAQPVPAPGAEFTVLRTTLAASAASLPCKKSPPLSPPSRWLPAFDSVVSDRLRNEPVMLDCGDGERVVTEVQLGDSAGGAKTASLMTNLPTHPDSRLAIVEGPLSAGPYLLCLLLLAAAFTAIWRPIASSPPPSFRMAMGVLAVSTVVALASLFESAAQGWLFVFLATAGPALATTAVAYLSNPLHLDKLWKLVTGGN